MKNFLWGIESFNDSPIHIVLFVSRNKDNKDILGFKERRMSFITHDEITSDSLSQKFSDFVKRGVAGELSRMYYSVNERNGEKIYTQLLHFLFDNPDFNLCSIQSKLAGIAAQKECAKTKHWMFDFDDNDIDKLNKFTKDIENCDKELKITIYFTPHGYAVVTDHGFDCRELLEKWGNIATLKRDDLICFKWETKPIEIFDF